MKMREFHILYIEWGAKLKIVKHFWVQPKDMIERYATRITCG